MKLGKPSMLHQLAKTYGWVGPKGAAADATALLLEDLGTDESDTTLVPHPDGSGGVDWGAESGTASGPAGGDLSGTYPNPTVVGLLGVLIQAWSGALSHPPTEAEVETIVGSPTTKAGLFVGITDTGTGNYVDMFFSTGSAWMLVPMVRLTGTGGGGGGGGVPSLLALSSPPEGGM